MWAIVHDNATEEWPHGNTGVVIGDDGVLVVDSTYLPSRARADIALIRQLTDKPVRYLVYTHWHFDHNNGGIAYREAFPAVSVVSQRDTARWIELNGIWWSRMQTATGSPHRVSLEKLQAQLSAGKDEKGAPLGAEARRALERNIEQRKGGGGGAGQPPGRDPGPTLRSRADPHPRQAQGPAAEPRQGQQPRRRDGVPPRPPGPLHRRFSWFDAPLPYVGASWPLPWIGVLRELESVPVRSLVPGHGPVMHDHAYTRAVRDSSRPRPSASRRRFVRAAPWSRSSRR